MISYALILITSSGLGRLRGAGRHGPTASGAAIRSAAPPRSRKLLGCGASILGPVRRLGWFLVGATTAAGALVAAPRLYERLRGVIGASDPWTELEPEERQWGVLREAPPVETEPEPWVAEPEPDPEDTAVRSPEPEAAEAPVEEAPAEAAAPVEEPEPEPVAAAEPEQDDDTDEITPAPLTAAPPPDDSAASELRSRIQSSRARLRRKARAAGGDDEDDESEVSAESDESDEPDQPDSSA